MDRQTVGADENKVIPSEHLIILLRVMHITLNNNFATVQNLPAIKNPDTCGFHTKLFYLENSGNRYFNNSNIQIISNFFCSQNEVKTSQAINQN